MTPHEAQECTLDELELWAAAANSHRLAQASLAMSGVSAAIAGAFDGKTGSQFIEMLARMQKDMR